jgi:hypothetical protein
VIGQVMKRLRFVEVCKFENKHTNQMSKHRWPQWEQICLP